MENACTGCYNLVQDGERVLMYYRGYYPIGTQQADTAAHQTTNLAVSHDGIHFERPSLGFFDFDGTRNHNIVWRGVQSHNMVVFLDRNPAALADARFKAVGGCGRRSLYGLVSPDGIHWRLLQPEPLDIEGAFDSVNVAFWDARAGKYRLFSRWWDQTHKVRAIQSSESEDFLHWTAPVAHRYTEGAPWEHFYTNATVPCPGAEHILLSFPMRFIPDRTRSTEGMDYPAGGVSDAVLISSRDGVRWDRSFLEGWLRAGLDPRNWTHRNQTPAVGIIQTAPDEWSMYASEHYGWATNRLRRLAIRPQGFVSAHAGHAGGELLTKPLRLGPGALRLNYATSAVGCVQVEVQDAEGHPCPGFELSAMAALFGDELDAPVRWAPSADGPAWPDRPVRLRFVLKDADLFAFRVGEVG
jgi:hypothetical protein